MQVAVRRASPALAPASPSAPRRDASAWIAGALLGTFLLVFLIQGLPRITGPFGDNHDGRNGATWALASEAIREDGPVASRLGARLARTHEVYAHHPPLINMETVAAEATFGASHWATRLPAWLGAIATVLMLSWVLGARGLPPVACAGGVVIAFASPMFLLYGTMLDTLQTSLPFAVGLFLVWDRRRSVDASRWPIAVLAALCALSSWEAALLAAVLVAFDIAALRPRRLQSVARLPTLQGLAAGATCCVAWLWWSAGSLREITSQVSQRSASGERAWTIGNWFDFQVTYLQDLISPIALVLALIGIWFAARDARLRVPFAVFGSVVVVYPLVVPDAAVHHDYWNYWLVVPMAIAITAVLATIEERRSNRLIVHVLVALLAGLTVVGGLTATSFARNADREGRITADAFETAIEDRGHEIPFVAGVIPPARWVTTAGHSATRISGPSAARKLARTHGDQLVFVRCQPYSTWVDVVCGQGTDRRLTAVVHVSDLAR